MIRKPVLPRMLGLAALYCAVFFVLAILQFSGKGGFTQTIGGMTISGQYDVSAEVPVNPDERMLAGGVRIFFGGLEFFLKEDDSGFALINDKGEKKPANPECMVRSDDEALFRFPDGTELSFTSLYSGGSPELRINAGFAGETAGLEIPFKLRRASVLRESEGSAEFTVAHNGAKYQFTRSGRALEQGWLILDAKESTVAYRAKPAERAFSPGDYALAQARNTQTFNEALNRWKDQSFSYWNQTVPVQADEDMVIAYSGEAIRRGNYKTAVASVAQAFLEGNQRTYESSVFLGSMGRALRSFLGLEQSRITRVSRLINEKSPDFLKEIQVMDYLLARGYTNFADDGIALIRAMDPAALTLELVPGIFEGYTDLKKWGAGGAAGSAAGSAVGSGESPFGRLTDQACFLVSEAIRRDSEKDLVFVAPNNSIDTEFCFRLGKALLNWAESTGNDDWAALGRSFMLSVISLRNNTGSVPARLEVSENGVFSEISGSRTGSAKLYRLLNPGEYYPHAERLRLGSNTLWTWTASPSLRLAQEGSAITISVSFPMNETHYMMIRGVRPFTGLHLYNREWPSDSQFERYDSSGWIYSAQDQVLVLKMKHRVTVEQIKILYEGQN